MKYLILVMSILLSANVFAEDSKLIKVDLDVNSTVLIKADLDQEDMYYYIDKTACLCYFYRIGTGGPAMTTVPCPALKAHKKLEKYLTKCEEKKVEVEIEKTASAAEIPDALK